MGGLDAGWDKETHGVLAAFGTVEHRDHIENALTGISDNIMRLAWCVTDTQATLPNGGIIIAEAIGPNFMTNIYPEFKNLLDFSMSGTSKVSSHIHETVHHVGGEPFFDKERMRDSARDLARRRPAAARLNPESYEGLSMESMYEWHPCR